MLLILDLIDGVSLGVSAFIKNGFRDLLSVI